MANYDYERRLFSYLENIRSYVVTRPMVLGGVSGATGGSGGPPGGYIGVLPQYRVAFDSTEAEVWTLPGSGLSLIDNLNRIRYRIASAETTLSGVTVSGTDLHIGNNGAGDYISISLTDGTLTLVGEATVWDDIRVAGSNTRVGATAPTLAAFGPSGSLKVMHFESGHNDEVHFEIQMPHRWKEGTNIYPHVHWTPISTATGNVVWELEYTWISINGTFGAPGNMASAATAAGGTAWVHKMTGLSEGGNNYIDGTGKTISSMLVCRLHRNGNSGSDTLAADVAFLEFDIHYEVDSMGSKTYSTK